MNRFLLLISFFIWGAIVSAQTNKNSELFFEQGSSWKYLDDGSDQNTTWQTLSFDDAAWETGNAHFGFGEGDETTTLTSGFITYYFRKKVNLSNINDLDKVYFNLVHDDGAVLYINGTEAVRSSLMPSGTIDYLTGTTTYIPNDMENEFWTYEVDKSLFVNGENIIAVEVHNQTTSSSDISFDCYVTESVSINYKLDGPYVFYRNDSVFVKTIEKDGPKTYKYKDAKEAQLICRFPDGVDSFSVELQTELEFTNSVYDLPEKFFALSDIEGNLEAFVMLLQDAEIIDDKYNWIFGEGHFVFVGDMFDRGTNVTECLWLLYRLESQAKQANGQIHFILGNHDIMNLIYDFRYVATKYLDNMTLIGETLESVYASDTELGRWLRKKNLIERMGPFAFVHGGISPSVQALELGFEEMNYHGRYKIDSTCNSSPCSILNGGSEVGLYWYRGMTKENLSQVQVDSILNDFNIKHVVVGHTVFDEITMLYNNGVVAIDLDHEYNYNSGYMSALYYKEGNLYEFTTTGTDQTLKLLTSVTGIEEKKILNDSKVSIYPNPAKNTVTINCDKGTINKIEVYNTSGELVLCKTQIDSNNQIDISKLNSGIYCFYTFTHTKKYINKVVIF